MFWARNLRIERVAQARRFNVRGTCEMTAKQIPRDGPEPKPSSPPTPEVPPPRQPKPGIPTPGDPQPPPLPIDPPPTDPEPKPPNPQPPQFVGRLDGPGLIDPRDLTGESHEPLPLLPDDVEQEREEPA
jgi:hypothetical protein